MVQKHQLTQDQDYAWLLGIPKRQEFTQPKFHFGERVKWGTEATSGTWNWQTGRIIGLSFTANRLWTYLIDLDQNGQAADTESNEQSLEEQSLQLVKDSASLRNQLKPESEWLLTQQAAERLGLSATQLRKLRRKGLFKAGHHYRDTSVPGSGLPRWQWHLERCGKALEVAPERRRPRSRS